MTVYSDSSNIVWAADFTPMNTTPLRARQHLNDWVAATKRNDHAGSNSALAYLVYHMHCLAVKIPDIAVVSTCGKYVVIPAHQAATLAVDIRKVVRNSDEEFKNLPAWADIKKQFLKTRGDGVY